MQFNCREDIIQLTPLWQGERSADGRPRVSEDILRRMRYVTTEEAWSVLRNHEYPYQFEGNWLNLHPGRILVGRAVTGVFVPKRPDLHDCLMKHGHANEGRSGEMNSWIIQTLVKDDVVVIDLFGKVRDGTYAGGNLSTAIATRTGAGMVIHGGLRDAQQIAGMDNLTALCSGLDPTGIREVTLVGMNIPCRIGGAVCLPGDVVLGTMTGVLFIPAHLAEEVVEHSEGLRLRDTFGFQRLKEGVYTSSEMDTKWTPEIEQDFEGWLAAHSREELERLLWPA
jgi:regulator of RNase E activity RraA